MTTKLTKLTLDRIDVVDRPANPGSKILICKRDDSKEIPMTDVQKADKLCPDCGKMHDPKDPCPAEAKKRADLEAIAKRQAEELEIVKRDAAEARAEVQKLRDDREREVFIAKAATLKAYGPADTLGQDLKDIAKVLGTDRFAKFETRLRAVQKQVDEGQLFAELGVSGTEGGPISPMAQIEKLAAERVAKGNETKEQAMTAVLQTDAGKRLYEQHVNAMSGMRPGDGREE